MEVWSYFWRPGDGYSSEEELEGGWVKTTLANEDEENWRVWMEKADGVK